MANKINQIEIDSIIYDLQDKDAKAPFTGTKAEVQLAIAAGEIKEGDIVNITDDIGDYPGGGDYPSGVSNIVYLTQEQYDALPDDKLTDDIEYRITDEGTDTNADNVGYNNATSGLSAMNVQDAIDELSTRPGGGGGNVVYLTQEAYDALSDDKLTNGIEYRIMDGDADETARNISYDNNESGLEAINVQQAIDNIDSKIDKHIVCNDITAIPIVQALKDGEYGAVRMQGCFLDDPNPSINLYRKYNKTDDSFERSLGFYFDGTNFYGYGKTKDGEITRTKFIPSTKVDISDTLSYTAPEGNIQVNSIKAWTKGDRCIVVVSINNLGEWGVGGNLDIPITGLPKPIISQWHMGLVIGSNFVGAYVTPSTEYIRIRNLGNSAITTFENFNVAFDYQYQF